MDHLYFNKKDIPDNFFEGETKKPFGECVMCSETLEDKKYFVEKAFRKDPLDQVHRVIFEYAICSDCAQKKNGEMSVDSKKSVELYFEENVSRKEVAESSMDEDNIDLCMVSRTSLESCEEYVIYGLFEGDQMLGGVFPYGLSGKVLDEISELLSEETLGEIDDFIGEHFTGPPEFREILQEKKWAFI